MVDSMGTMVKRETTRGASDEVEEEVVD